jgi:hypothetical protein
MADASSRTDTSTVLDDNDKHQRVTLFFADPPCRDTTFWHNDTIVASHPSLFVFGQIYASISTLSHYAWATN